MVDAEHRRLGKTLLTTRLSSIGATAGRDRTASRSPPAPTAVLWSARPGLRQLLAHHRERRPAGWTGRTRGCRRCRVRRRASRACRRSLAKAPSSSKIPCTKRNPSASRSQTSWRNGVRAWSLTASWTICAEVLVGPVPAGETDQCERRRQQAAVGQVVDRRHQLLAGQVAGDPKITTAHGPAMRACVCRACPAAGCRHPAGTGDTLGGDWSRPWSFPAASS